MCRHQSLERGQDVGWSPRNRPPGLEHTQGGACHQERLWRERPVVRTSLLDGPPPRPPTTSGGHSHGQRGPLAHTLGSGGCSIPRVLQQLPEGIRALQWDGRRARGGGCRYNPHSACPGYWAPVTEEALEAWGGRCREAAWRTTFCVCLEGALGDMRLPADALGIPPRGASAGCVPRAPFTPP